MVVRRLCASDASEHEKLASLAFIFEAEPEKAVLPCEYMLGAFENDSLAADAEIEKRFNNYDGSLLSCLAVGGVASRPEMRRKGAVRAIFDELFSSEKADISILYPFSEAYYRKFGYAAVGGCVELEAPFSGLSWLEQSGTAELFEGKNAGELLSLYNECARTDCLSFVRENTSYFENEPYKNAAYTYIWKNSGGIAKAYATFSADRKSSVISVKEINFADKDGLLGILGFFKAYAGNFDTLRFEKLPVSSPVMNYLGDKSRFNMKYSNAGAVRVLDVQSVLSKHKYPVQGGSFIIGCHDTIEKNNSFFGVEYSDGKANVAKLESAKPDLILEPAAFSRILIEGSCEKELEYADGITICGKTDDFLRAFPKRDIFFCDCF